jgi:hypothetical protein
MQLKLTELLHTYKLDIENIDEEIAHIQFP